ncbi:MAG: prepilin peptidase, partial [Desulfuromonas sp.]
MPIEFYTVLGLAFILGAVIGSFLNVCIYRIPAGKSIISPPSSCPKCGAGIRWYQNIPILSWLLLGGRCAACKVRISIRY